MFRRIFYMGALLLFSACGGEADAAESSAASGGQVSRDGAGSGSDCAGGGSTGCLDDTSTEGSGGTASGGKSASSGGSDPGPGSGGAESLYPDAGFVADGVGTSGNLTGELWSFTRPDYDQFIGSLIEGENLCVSGTVALGNEDHPAAAGISWRLKPIVAPAGNALEYEIRNYGMTDLRITLEGIDRWCVEIPAEQDSGLIPWSDFVTNCHRDPKLHRPFDSDDNVTLIQVAAFAEDGGDETPFDFCVVHLGPAE